MTDDLRAKRQEPKATTTAKELTTVICDKIGVHEETHCQLFAQIESLIETVLKAEYERGFADGHACDNNTIKTKNEAFEAALKLAEENKVEMGLTAVRFDPECIKETLEQPEVALRKMHNSAIDSVIDDIRQLKGA